MQSLSIIWSKELVVLGVVYLYGGVLLRLIVMDELVRSGVLIVVGAGIIMYLPYERLLPIQHQEESLTSLAMAIME